MCPSSAPIPPFPVPDDNLAFVDLLTHLGDPQQAWDPRPKKEGEVTGLVGQSHAQVT